MFCSVGWYCCVQLPAWPGVSVCVCVASISLGRRVAPCCDCVYSFVTLWAALPRAHNWHCQRMERERDERTEKTDRGQEQSWLISCSLAPSPAISCYWSKQNIFSQNTLFHCRPTLPHRSRTSLILSVAGLAATDLGAVTVLSESIIVMDCCRQELS